jgi:hypothetical protein
MKEEPNKEIPENNKPKILKMESSISQIKASGEMSPVDWNKLKTDIMAGR